MKNISDKSLYELCQKYGKNARIWKRKFIALLPEVYKRRLYRKKGFGSIFEFAAKLGGISKNVVREMIRVDEKLKNMPKLRGKISKTGIHKIRIVAGIATKETEEKWAKKVEEMTKSALETHVRDMRGMSAQARSNKTKTHPGMSLPITTQNSLFCNEQERGHVCNDREKPIEENALYDNKYETFSIKLKPETIQKLKHLKANMKNGTCWNEVVEKLLSETKIKKSRARGLKAHPKQVCEVPGCKKPATIIHHKDRFAITKTHENLTSLCSSHHELAHRGYLNEQNTSKTLKPLAEAISDPLKKLVDQKMLAHLQKT